MLSARMRLSILVLVVTLSIAASAKSKPKKVKRPKPIDWSHPYYSGKFVLCKKMRNFNPVELAKAQAWATDAFRRCGPPIVINFATKFSFPAYAIERLLYEVCWGLDVAYAFMANDGGLIVSPDTETRTFFAMAKLILGSMARVERNFTVKNRGETYSLPYNKVTELVYNLLKCSFPGNKISQIDGDVVKHAVAHGKVILL